MIVGVAIAAAVGGAIFAVKILGDREQPPPAQPVVAAKPPVQPVAVQPIAAQPKTTVLQPEPQAPEPKPADPLEEFKPLVAQVETIVKLPTSFDVDKTNSLVSPYLGVIRIEQQGRRSVTTIVVHCAYQGGRWVYKNSTIDNDDLSLHATYTTETQLYRRIANVFQ